MAETVALTEAVRALSDHFGERLDVGRDEGRDQMVEVLAAKFGISKDQAKELVGDLERARSIRWIEGGTGPSAAPLPTLSAGGVIASAPQTSGGAYAYGQTAGGYWQL